eukprot:jgi/Chlat1/7602/Chrsp64S07156
MNGMASGNARPALSLVRLRLQAIARHQPSLAGGARGGGNQAQEGQAGRWSRRMFIAQAAKRAKAIIDRPTRPLAITPTLDATTTTTPSAPHIPGSQSKLPMAIFK